MLSPAMAASSPRLAGAILIAAGAYQLTPFKGACLTQCRSPLGFLMTNWRDGNMGALQMGVRHGVYCLGCCWALMCVLFVVGVMNLAWVAALTVFVLIEKVGPAGAARGARRRGRDDRRRRAVCRRYPVVDAALKGPRYFASRRSLDFIRVERTASETAPQTTTARD